MKHFIRQRKKALKHRIYEYVCVTLDFLLVIFFSVIALLFTTLFTDDRKILIPSVVAAVISGMFFIQKHRLEKLRLVTDLFRDFNKRYDDLNERLNKILISTEELKEIVFDNGSGVKVNAENVLFDYFNLCAEEYLYYKKGYILLDVWEAWRNGMKTFFNEPRIKKLWEKDSITNSYYNFNPYETS